MLPEPVGNGHFRLVLARIEIPGGNNPEYWKQNSQQTKTQALLVQAETSGK